MKVLQTNNFGESEEVEIYPIDDNKTMKERTLKIIKFYAHDYRDMKMSEIDLEDMLKGFLESIECKHQCISDCRRKGCNCDCGEYHF